MLRRQWIGLTAAAIAATAWQSDQSRPTTDTADAGATQDSTPRVGVVLSSFAGSADHDGTKLRGLQGPIPPDAPASDEVLNEMVRKAIELGTTGRGGLSKLVDEQDWVVIKPHIAVCQRADGSLVAGSVADVRVVRSVIEWLVEHHLGSRITIAEAPTWAMSKTFDPWESDWSGAFGKVSYRRLVDDLSRRHASVRFDIVHLTEDQTTALQPPGGSSATRQGRVVYDFPATLLECDKLITVAPLSTSSWTVVSLTVGSYYGVLRSLRHDGLREHSYGAGNPHELVADLFSLRPPDYAILGGEQGQEGDGPYGTDVDSVHHNIVLAGASAVAVDSVGASIMGFDPAKVQHLELAAKRGLGITDTDSIWTRGNEIDEAKRPFQPARS